MFHEKHSLVKSKLSHSAEKEGGSRGHWWGRPHCGPRGWGQNRTGEGAGFLCPPRGEQREQSGRQAAASVFWTGWSRQSVGKAREDQSSGSRPHPSVISFLFLLSCPKPLGLGPSDNTISVMISRVPVDHRCAGWTWKGLVRTQTCDLWP